MCSAYHIIYHNESLPEVLPNSLYQYRLLRTALSSPMDAVSAAPWCADALAMPVATRPSDRCWDVVRRAE